MYESTPGATVKGIAADLGISRGALREWVEKLGRGVIPPPPEAARVRRAKNAAAAIPIPTAMMRSNGTVTTAVQAKTTASALLAVITRCGRW